MADQLFSTPIEKKGTVRKFADISQSSISPLSETKGPPLKMRPLQVLSPEEKRTQIENIVHEVIKIQLSQIHIDLENKLSNDFKSQISLLNSELESNKAKVEELEIKTNNLLKYNASLENTV